MSLLVVALVITAIVVAMVSAIGWLLRLRPSSLVRGIIPYCRKRRSPSRWGRLGLRTEGRG
jgi:hypothetical protein